MCRRLTSQPRVWTTTSHSCSLCVCTARINDVRGAVAVLRYPRMPVPGPDQICTARWACPALALADVEPWPYAVSVAPRAAAQSTASRGSVPQQVGVCVCALLKQIAKQSLKIIFKSYPVVRSHSGMPGKDPNEWNYWVFFSLFPFLVLGAFCPLQLTHPSPRARCCHWTERTAELSLADSQEPAPR